MAVIKHLVNLDLSKNQLLNAVVQNLAVAPTSPNVGQIYYDTVDDTIYSWTGSSWLDLGNQGTGGTDLDYTAAVSQGTVTSNTGTDAIIPLADGTNAGLFTAAEKTKLGNIETNAKDDQNASEVSSSASGNLVATNVQSALEELQGSIDTTDGNVTTNATNIATNATNIGNNDTDIAANATAIAALDTNVSTNITIVENALNVSVNSSDGTNDTIAAATTSLSGVMIPAQVTALSAATSGVATNATNIASNDTDIATNASAIAALDTNVSTNITIVESATNVDVQSSDGTNDTIAGATTSLAGVMVASDKTKLDGIATGAEVNVDDVLTTLGLSANILKYTDEAGTETDLDLSLYLDDTNLARLTSGSLNAGTGLATFTRDDASTFTIDMSAFLDAITLNNTLTSTSTTEGLTANMGKELKDLIDALVLSTGTNTGDETSATLSNEGIAFLASQAEVNTGSNTTKIITPSRLRSTLGITANLSTTLTYSQLVGGATSQIITHAIGNQFVSVSVYEVAGMDKVECEIELTSTTTTTLKFNVAPAANSLRVVIIG